MISYNAVLVGGCFDMTKRVVTSDLPQIFMYEPMDYRLAANMGIANAGGGGVIPCRQVIYSLVYSLSDGTLIYEYERVVQ
tara:strand:- start:962 stop:1201 length:240 start_codon:yes stop_codon:yes gene_type:complete